MSFCFLDFDGVLNSLETLWEMNSKPFPETPFETYRDDLNLHLPLRKHIKVLNDLVKFDPDLRFVVSSSWRHYPLFILQGLLLSRGFRGVIIGRTPILEWTRHRGREIKEYLLQYKLASERIVILDDDRRMQDLDRFHVLVDNRVGLVPDDIEKAKSILSHRVWPGLSNTHG